MSSPPAAGNTTSNNLLFLDLVILPVRCHNEGVCVATQAKNKQTFSNQWDFLSLT